MLRSLVIGIVAFWLMSFIPLFAQSRDLVERALTGDAKAQYRLGSIYYYGYGVDQDRPEGATWWRIAADQGLSVAQYRLAAEQGSAKAQYNLGYAYDFGEDVDQDYAEAVQWYRLAAEQGFPDAQIRLGVAHFQGNGVDVDDVLALMWFQVAASVERATQQTVQTKLLGMIDSIKRLMTPSQIAEAQVLAQVCLSREFRYCGE